MLSVRMSLMSSPAAGLNRMRTRDETGLACASTIPGCLSSSRSSRRANCRLRASARTCQRSRPRVAEISRTSGGKSITGRSDDVMFRTETALPHCHIDIAADADRHETRVFMGAHKAPRWAVARGSRNIMRRRAVRTSDNAGLMQLLGDSAFGLLGCLGDHILELLADDLDHFVDRSLCLDAGPNRLLQDRAPPTCQDHSSGHTHNESQLFQDGLHGSGYASQRLSIAERRNSDKNFVLADRTDQFTYVSRCGRVHQARSRCRSVKPDGI